MNQSLLILMLRVACSTDGYRLGKFPRFLWFLEQYQIAKLTSKMEVFCHINWVRFFSLDLKKEQQVNHIVKVHFFIWHWECFCFSLLATVDSYSSARASSGVSPAHIYLVLQKTQWLQEQDPQAWRKSAFPFANHYTAAGFSFRFRMKLCSLSARLIFDGFG